ncbi:lipopolysaccharide biogenesis periplasmic protein AsmA [Neokomagataea thailandica NBRC 106555]|uniref:Lipopolysaccharide biogenesis periplasmic protein AsmA n=1 Tax=Neokomagataea thailandica NBRC 106555 TaxID=1223520 RepID=A0ABQ0QQC8_9PROT|nr:MULTISPECIES: AsmA family protein [Neokomagataea]GBR53177.1 lipopolysaccharide biogenesis periplasmic protein AsmA [Neokomagataea thailandica NBRC 106555]
MKKLVVAVIMFFVLVVGASVAVNVLVDQDALRARVAIALKQETGLDLKVEQSAIQFLPWPSIVARNVVLSRPGDEPFFKAGSLHAGLSVLALLQREVRFQDFVVDGAQISLHRAADGQLDWMVHAPRGQEEEAPLPVNGFEAKRIEAHWAVALDALHLTNSTILWSDQRLHWRGGFTVRALDLAGLRTPSPWINLSGDHAGTPFSLKGHLGALNAFGSAATPNGQAWSFSLATSLGPDTRRDWMNVDGSISDPRLMRGLILRVRGEWLDLQDMQKLFPHADLPHIPSFGGDISLSGDIDKQALSVKSVAAQGNYWPMPGITVTAIHLHAGNLPIKHVTFGHVTIGADSEQAPLSVETDIEWQGSDWHASGQAGTLAGITDFLRRAGKGNFVPVHAELRSEALSLSNTLGASSSSPPLNAQDNLVLTVSGSLGATAKLTVQGKADQLHTPFNLLHDVAVGGAVTINAQHDYTIDDLALESQEAALAGNVLIKRSDGSRVHLAGSLTSKHLDIDALMQASGSSIPPKGATSAAITAKAPASVPQALVKMGAAADKGGTSASEVAPPSADAQNTEKALPSWVQWLRKADGDMHISAEQLHAGGVDYAGISAQISLSAGHLMVDGLKGQSLTVPLGGKLDIDASTLPAHLHVQASSFIMPAEWVQGVIEMPEVLRGPVQIVGELSGAGQDTESLRATLAGSIGFSMVDARVSGTWLAHLAGPQAAAFIGNGERSLRCLGTHLTLSDGSAIVDALGLQAGNMQVSGHGQIGLVAENLTLHLRPSLQLAGAEASAPIMLDGPWHNLSVQPERDANGNAQLTLGGASDTSDDPCGAWLAAGRQNQPGPEPKANERHHNRASDLLKALGVLH